MCKLALSVLIHVTTTASAELYAYITPLFELNRSMKNRQDDIVCEGAYEWMCVTNLKK